MILTTHDLWRHISRCSACICVIVGLDCAGDTQVGDPEIPLIVENQVFWFDIAVNDVVKVEKLETDKDASNEELRLSLLESAATAHVIA